MTDYRKLVSRTPPVGLLAAAGEELDTAGLVYEAIWVQDESIETMLMRPGRKMRAVRCTCSECGRSAVLGYVPPSESGGGHYGFSHPSDFGHGVTQDGQCTLCPVCESPVSVRCAATVGNREFSTAEATVLSASLLPGEPGEPGERPLVITGWQIRRLVNRYCGERYEVRPMEAYVFEARDAYKLTGWTRAYSGNGGYHAAVYREWHQPKDWRETWGRVDKVVGLTPELVAESCLPNCKLDVYMANGAWRVLKSPVAYLRLYQKYSQVENLVVQGCGYLLDGLIAEVMGHSDWNQNRKGFAALPELRLEENRPAKMLGLTMDEFAVMRDQCWGLYHWRVYIKAKAAGDRMKLPEDITLLHEYGSEDIGVVIGRAPVGKTLRYLMNQMMDWGAANDPYDEYAEYAADDDLLDADFLVDYWNMAEQAGWDLTIPAIRWPKNLVAAHDRAMNASEAVLSRTLETKFRARAKVLAKFMYVSGPLLIRPAASQKDLTREGQLLDHCVAGYGKEIALGTKAIFLIRHAWAPRQPYFTLEYDEQGEAVKQNRGKKNCARTPEVEAFEAEWLAWIKAGCRRCKDGTPVGAKPVVKEKPEVKTVSKVRVA